VERVDREDLLRALDELGVQIRHVWEPEGTPSSP